MKPFDLIVPVFNEAMNLPIFLARLEQLRPSCQVIFVDNASTDGSLEILKKYPGALVIEHKSNLGYGSSIIDGIAAGKNDDIVIIDADCEYPPECIPELLAGLENHAVVYGSRFTGRGSRSKMPWLRKQGNRLISELFNAAFNQDVSDLYTGCKAFKRSSLHGITLQQKGFEHVLELAAKLAARHIHIHEIPVDYTARRAGISKMKHIPETAKYLYLLLRYAQLYRAGKL